jgi:hypothetical protein
MEQHAADTKLLLCLPAVVGVQHTHLHAGSISTALLSLLMALRHAILRRMWADARSVVCMHLLHHWCPDTWVARPHHLLISRPFWSGITVSATSLFAYMPSWILKCQERSWKHTSGVCARGLDGSIHSALGLQMKV